MPLDNNIYRYRVSSWIYKAIAYKKKIILDKGFTYNFVNTTGGSHPFAIRVSNGGSSYTSGVSGSTTGTQTFIVPMNAPSTLYYQCTIHVNMGNTINII